MYWGVRGLLWNGIVQAAEFMHLYILGFASATNLMSIVYTGWLSTNGCDGFCY
jgi:hypothetical protein